MTSEPGLGSIDQVVALADAYFDAGKYESAREVVGRSLGNHPDDPVLLANYARAELALDNHWQAARSAYASLAGAPEDEFAMRLYASSLYNLARERDALWMAWRTVTTHPNRPEPLRLYARLLHKSRQSRSALTVIDMALRLDPQSVDALILRGSILRDLKRGAESHASFRAALERDPDNADALNELAIHRLQRLKIGRALKGFLGAARSNPAYGHVMRRNIGVVLQRLFIAVTIGAGILGVLLACAAGVNDARHSAAVLRVLVGILTVGLIAVLHWLLRTLPRHVIFSVLREQPFTTLRIAHASLAVVAGGWVAVYPGPSVMVVVGGLLAVSALVIIRIGLFIGK